MNNEDRRVEQIVAYLDGELSSVEASLVERQLAEDADFRQELQSIERAWSALDALPTAKVGDSFSQTTLELVVGAARQEVLEKTRALPVVRRRNLLGKVLVGCSAMVLGFVLVRAMRENPNRVLLADLPAIEYIDVYSQFRELEYIRRLNEQLGDRIWESELSATELAARQDEFETVADGNRRREWIDQLDEQDRSTLRGRYNRFTSLSPEEQARIRDLHAELVSASDSDQLQRTLLQYQAWVSALPASRQFELRSMPVIDRVREVVAQQRREANNPWITLSPEELRRLDRALVPIREQIIRKIGREPRGEGRGRAPGARPEIRRELMEHQGEWLPQIIAALSPEAREKFEALPPMQQQRQVGRWIVDVNLELGPRRGRQRFAEVSQQELEEFFVEQLRTSPERVEQWLAQPRDVMEEQLKREYLREEIGGEGFPAPGRPIGPPPRGEFDRRRGPPDRPRSEGPRGDGPPPPPPRESS